MLQSDHTLLILCTSSNIFNAHFNFKFEKTWLKEQGFKELFSLWWNSYIILLDVGE
jgi:hypothetical protein